MNAAAAAKGVWFLIFLIAIVLFLALWIPMLIHLLIELSQIGWRAAP